ncbi:S41 family peptidase [Porphyromonas circumdentaria]|nr:S41 family peptidase [Porphyromonas circumdentaria]MBB6275572.1 carboxyl-terminal processing protease [Porphyromonas circumdentaria]
MKRNNLPVTLLVTFFLSLYIAPTALAQSENKEQRERKEYYEALQVTGTILSGVQNYFVDTIALPKVHALGMNAMLQRLDPYTEYMTPEEAKAFREATSGSYAGIGAIINQRPDSVVVINEPMQGQPADKAGLKTGDRILEIDGKDFRKSTSTVVSKALRGEDGTTITVKVLRRGEQTPRTFTFERKRISVNSVAFADFIEDGMGYIALSSFTQDSGKDVKQAIKNLKEKALLKSLILDLRSNGGGVLQSAVEILGLFLPKGSKVLDVKGRNISTNASYSTTDTPMVEDVPLVVMINDESASASEIVAGALQDHDRAVIVGEKSFGKGLVQSTLVTPGNGLLKLTTAHYYIPSGRSIQKINYNHLGSTELIKTDTVGIPFQTLGGRKVYASGGITPDVDLSADTLAGVVTFFAIDTLVADYVTDYVRTHPKMVQADRFRLSDAEYEEFIRHLEKNKFSYKTGSTFYLDKVEELIRRERLYAVAETEIEALRKKIASDVRRDATLFKEDIKQYIEGQIVRIAYYREGYYRYILPQDKQLKSVRELLANPKRYQQILHPAKT